MTKIAVQNFYMYLKFNKISDFQCKLVFLHLYSIQLESTPQYNSWNQHYIFLLILASVTAVTSNCLKVYFRSFSKTIKFLFKEHALIQNIDRDLLFFTIFNGCFILSDLEFTPLSRSSFISGLLKLNWLNLRAKFDERFERSEVSVSVFFIIYIQSIIGDYKQEEILS